MESTSSRIQSLEKDLRGMKKILMDSTNSSSSSSKKIDGERPKSFHYVPKGNDNSNSNSNKIVRGDRGSVSSSSFGFDRSIMMMGIHDEDEGSCEFHNDGSAAATKGTSKSFRKRLIKGLKNAFRVS